MAHNDRTRIMSDPSDSDHGIDEYIDWLETFDPAEDK